MPQPNQHQISLSVARARQKSISLFFKKSPMFSPEDQRRRKIAAPSLAPSPPAQCWPTLRAARCRVTRASSHPWTLLSPPLSHFLRERTNSLRRFEVTGFVSERSVGEKYKEGQVACGVSHLFCSSHFQPPGPLGSLQKRYTLLVLAAAAANFLSM